MVSQAGCVVSILDVDVPYHGKTAFQVKAWDDPDECGGGSLTAAGSILLIRAEPDVEWVFTIIQHRIQDAERVPWNFEGAGSTVGVPLFLNERQAIRVQSTGTGPLRLQLLGLYKDRDQSYEAFAWTGDLSSGASTNHTGPTGVYLPVMTAQVDRTWRVEFRANY